MKQQEFSDLLAATLDSPCEQAYTLDLELALRYHEAVRSMEDLFSLDHQIEHMKDCLSWTFERVIHCRSVVNRLSRVFRRHEDPQKVAEWRAEESRLRRDREDYLTHVNPRFIQLQAICKKKQEERNRTAKRKRINDKCSGMSKKAKTKIVIHEDPRLSKLIVRNEQDKKCCFVVDAHVMSNIFAFVGSSTSGTFLGLRLVCKSFFFVCHQTVDLWRMPSVLDLNTSGVGNGNHMATGYLDYWYRRLVLYSLYSVQGNDKKAKARRKRLTKIILRHQKIHAENEEPKVKINGVFSRVVRMAETLMIHVPPELMNQNCTLMVACGAHQSLVAKLLKLRISGLTILDTSRLCIYHYHHPTVDGFRFVWGGHVEDNVGNLFRYEKVDFRPLLLAIAPQLQSLSIKVFPEDKAVMLTPDLIFPEVTELTKSRYLVIPQEQTMFPKLNNKSS